MAEEKPTITVAEHLTAYQLLYDTILFRINEAMAIHMDKFSDKTVLPKEFQNPDAFSTSHTEYLTREEIRERYGDMVHFKSEPGQKVKDPSKKLQNNGI